MFTLPQLLIAVLLGFITGSFVTSFAWLWQLTEFIMRQIESEEK